MSTAFITTHHVSTDVALADMFETFGNAEDSQATILNVNNKIKDALSDKLAKLGRAKQEIIELEGKFSSDGKDKDKKDQELGKTQGWDSNKVDWNTASDDLIERRFRQQHSDIDLSDPNVQVTINRKDQTVTVSYKDDSLPSVTGHVDLQNAGTDSDEMARLDDNLKSVGIYGDNNLSRKGYRGDNVCGSTTKSEISALSSADDTAINEVNALSEKVTVGQQQSGGIIVTTNNDISAEDKALRDARSQISNRW